MKKKILKIFLTLFFLACKKKENTIERQFLPLELNETSGLEYFNENFITHNDSGGKPLLYEFNKEGKIIRQSSYYNGSALNN